MRTYIRPPPDLPPSPVALLVSVLLVFAYNEAGNIPPELGRLSSLEHLELDGNAGLTAGKAQHSAGQLPHS